MGKRSLTLAWEALPLGEAAATPPEGSEGHQLSVDLQCRVARAREWLSVRAGH